MSSAEIIDRARSEGKPGHVSVPQRKQNQTLTLLFVLVIGFSLIAFNGETHLITTLLLYMAVCLVGLWLTNQTARYLNDRKLKILGSLWLIKVLATLLLLYVGWIPQLDPNASASWGYDPQRYYQYAWYLVLQNWSPIGLEQNYQGILYYYGAIFAILGHNPVIPALVNAFVTLLGTLYLIRCVYEFMPNRTSSDWRIAYLLLVPEVLWYEVMTSRETLMAVLIIFATVPVGKYLFCDRRSGLTNSLLLTAVAVFAIMVVRTSMLLPVMACLAIFALLLKKRKSASPLFRILIIALGVTGILLAPLAQEMTGGYAVDFIQTPDKVQTFEGNIAEEMEWSDRSVGMLLMPSGLLSSVAFLPPRMLLYLAAPLPNIGFSPADLLAGSWFAWQSLMTFLTSVLMLLCFPYVLAGSGLAWRLRGTYPGMVIVPIAFWMNFVSVAGGNLIIHERYRLMFTLLLFATAWIGYTRCSPTMVRHWAIPWFGLLGSGAIFYFVYKLS